MKPFVWILLAAIAAYLLLGIPSSNAPMSFGYQSGSNNLAGSSSETKVYGSNGGFLSLIDDSNCESVFPDGDCFRKAEINTYGNAQSEAFAKISTKNDIEDATPAYVDYAGKEVYIGDLSIKYQCEGDKAYIREGDLDWRTCTESGCSGNSVSKSGTYTFTAPQDGLKQVRFQCWDYDKGTASNGDWSSSWVWAGLYYEKNPNVRLVVAAEDLDGDGVTEDKDACRKTPHGTAVDATGCPTISTNPVPTQNETTTNPDSEEQPSNEEKPSTPSIPSSNNGWLYLGAGVLVIAALWASVKRR